MHETIYGHVNALILPRSYTDNCGQCETRPVVVLVELVGAVGCCHFLVVVLDDDTRVAFRAKVYLEFYVLYSYCRTCAYNIASTRKFSSRFSNDNLHAMIQKCVTTEMNCLN